MPLCRRKCWINTFLQLAVMEMLIGYKHVHNMFSASIVMFWAYWMCNTFCCAQSKFTYFDLFLCSSLDWCHCLYNLTMLDGLGMVYLLSITIYYNIGRGDNILKILRDFFILKVTQFIINLQRLQYLSIHF